MISEDIQKQNETLERYKERVTNFSNNFEIGLYNHTIKESQRRKIIRKWNTNEV